MHVDLLTPSFSTQERLQPRLNVQSVVGNPTLLLWLRRRDVNPSVRSSRAPMLPLPPYPLNEATSTIVHEPSTVLLLCVSVYGCMGVSRSIPWWFCVHINNNHYLCLQCLDLL